MSLFAAPVDRPRRQPGTKHKLLYLSNLQQSRPHVTGILWAADQAHEIRLQSAGSARVESLTVEPKPEALHLWVAQLRARFPQGKVALALEQSRGAVIYALMNYDFLLLYPVPPKALARYREAFATRGAKTDRTDADLRLELVRTHADRLRPPTRRCLDAAMAPAGRAPTQDGG